ncbi:hypothetical protein LX32DRAFT_642640 [Colletotrichum zoysiae]|uniref:Secreted protein n=1 Tax=Colletotrichum zoysiae TaxID=1216348 RepID=A0AAD9HAN4_9PEZI|nr:hypothetical protein LX32DRAFT_642640 [Colletotrichum zoysiae]
MNGWAPSLLAWHLLTSTTREVGAFSLLQHHQSSSPDTSYLHQHPSSAPTRRDATLSSSNIHRLWLSSSWNAASLQDGTVLNPPSFFSSGDLGHKNSNARLPQLPAHHLPVYLRTLRTQ